MAKHKYIETPEKMWELFCDYREDVNNNPFEISEQRKGTVVLPKNFDGELAAVVKLPMQRPLTMEGFENYCADQNVVNDLGDYFSNNEGRYCEYATICKRIKRVIRQNQIEGGMCGAFVASITQRLNGLVEKQSTDLTTGGDKITVTLNL